MQNCSNYGQQVGIQCQPWQERRFLRSPGCMPLPPTCSDLKRLRKHIYTCLLKCSTNRCVGTCGHGFDSGLRSCPNPSPSMGNGTLLPHSAQKGSHLPPSAVASLMNVRRPLYLGQWSYLNRHKCPKKNMVAHRWLQRLCNRPRQ